MYRPSPFITPVKLIETKSTRKNGVSTKENIDKGVIFCSFKTYGGTEKAVNDRVVVEDTATIETWYRPDITASSRIEKDGQIYEVFGTPEDIECRHKFIKFKVKSIKGGT